jgi:hypothetical protein
MRLALRAFLSLWKGFRRVKLSQGLGDRGREKCTPCQKQNKKNKKNTTLKLAANFAGQIPVTVGKTQDFNVGTGLYTLFEFQFASWP